MNANLKQLMRDAGYPATDGANWVASDTKTFQGFAVRELGVPFSQTSSMLAYPEAFPAALARLSAMAGVVPEPAAAPIVPQTVVEAVQATLPPEPVVEPAAAFDGFDLSAQGQTPKQELVQPPAAVIESTESTESAEAAEAAEGGTEQGADEENTEGPDEDGDTPPEDSGDDEGADEEGADDVTEDGADEENTEGPDEEEGDSEE